MGEKKIMQVVKKTNKHPILQESYKIFSIIVGGVVTGIGLEAFLIPNGFLDGGITGVSIILSNFIKLPMGLFLGILNIPFIVIPYFMVGKRSAVRTAIGVITLSLSTIIMHHMNPWTDNFVLALGYGGLLLGLGVGVALRQGGALDGTEALASIISNKSPYSVDQIILCVNIVIFGTAAFVLDVQSAMASALLYYVVVSPIIKKVVDGNSEIKMAKVMTTNPKLIADHISQLTKRRISTINRSVYDSKSKEFVNDISELTFTVSRLEESTITDKILEKDPQAIILFNELSSLRGGIYEK